MVLHFLLTPNYEQDTVIGLQIAQVFLLERVNRKKKNKKRSILLVLKP